MQQAASAGNAQGLIIRGDMDCPGCNCKDLLGRRAVLRESYTDGGCCPSEEILEQICHLEGCRVAKILEASFERDAEEFLLESGPNVFPSTSISNVDCLAVCHIVVLCFLFFLHYNYNCT